MAFQCTVVTPEHQAFEGTISQAILPAHDGLIGVLTDRAPLLVKLGVGVLRLDQAGEQKHYFLVDGGIAQMKDNRLTILTSEATPAQDIDIREAEAEYAEALAMHPTNEKALQERQRRLAHATAKRGLARK
ncbi:MAG: ATP synthase F1 subunit epsilon [Bacillota bacterium]